MYTSTQIQALTNVINSRNIYTVETKARILKFIETGKIHKAIFEATKGSFLQTIAAEALYREMEQANPCDYLTPSDLWEGAT